MKTQKFNQFGQEIRSEMWSLKFIVGVTLKLVYRDTKENNYLNLR